MIRTEAKRDSIRHEEEFPALYETGSRIILVTKREGDYLVGTMVHDKSRSMNGQVGDHSHKWLASQFKRYYGEVTIAGS